MFLLRDQWYFQIFQLSPVVGITNPKVVSWHARVAAPPQKPEVSPLLSSPHRRLVERVFEKVRGDRPAGLRDLAPVPAFPNEDPNTKLDKVLSSLDSLTT